MHSSTVGPRDFVKEFHNDPIGSWVYLPDNTLAVVKQVIKDDVDGTIYRVQGITRKGRYCKLPFAVPRWHPADDLRIFYYTASINPQWSNS